MSLHAMLDPVWPWASASGRVGLFIVLAVIVGLTVWTYRSEIGTQGRRVATLLTIRLLALVVACLLVLRPSIATSGGDEEPSTLLLVSDASESMTIQDQYDNQSRWSYQQRLLREAEPHLAQLRDHQHVSIFQYQFAGEAEEIRKEPKPDGRRTDFGAMLHGLFERHGGDRSLRGLFILSDGADNGTRYLATAEAAKWRSAGCPIFTVALGRSDTSSNQRDLALTSIQPDPSPVAVKGKLTVKATLDAPGLEASVITLRLLIQDQEVAAIPNIRLNRAQGNELLIETNAPVDPGEIKVTLRVDPLPGEVTVANNEISTYVTVSKEGISVLYVEGKYRANEPKFIRYALSQEPSIRLYEAVRITDEPLPTGQADWFQFEKQRYDVIILGDISAHRLTGGQSKLLTQLHQQVFEKGAGLMMIGGYESFGNSDWAGSPIAKALPVELDAKGQVEDKVPMVPTQPGLRHYIMKLAENPADNATLWSKLPKLDGITRLGKKKPASEVLADSPKGEPILIGQLHYGKGRTLAFAGDTTWRWCRNPELMRLHHRFWQQVVFWLAKRDEAEGSVLILPDTRRLATGGKLGLTLKARGKGGLELPEQNVRFEALVIGPDGAESKITTTRERGDERGYFWKTDLPGEYVIKAKATGTDLDGTPLPELPAAVARFVVYQDVAEMLRQAADHDFLGRISQAGGGKALAPEEFTSFLKELAANKSPSSAGRVKVWPDWRRNPASKTVGDQLRALSGSGMLWCLLAFVFLLCSEWGLRRYWGWV